jgi:DNA-binding beta-propeller fold protein YncE
MHRTIAIALTMLMALTPLTSVRPQTGSSTQPCPSSPLPVLWYVTTHSGNDVLRYDASGNFIDHFVAKGSGGLDEARGFAFGPDGNLYVANAHESLSTVLRFDSATGAFLPPVFASGNGLAHPYSVTFGAPYGDLYVSNQDVNTVLTFDGRSGAFLRTFVTNGSGGLSEPRLAIFGPDGHFYVASRGTDQILRYHGSSGAFKDVFVHHKSGGLDKPIQFVFWDNHVLAGSSGNNQILRYHMDGSFKDVFVDGNKSSGGGLASPSGLAIGPDGKLYVGSRTTNQILRYSSDGSFDCVFISSNVTGMTEPEFIMPVPIAAGGQPQPPRTP